MVGSLSCCYIFIISLYIRVRYGRVDERANGWVITGRSFQIGLEKDWTLRRLGKRWINAGDPVCLPSVKRPEWAASKRTTELTGWPVSPLVWIWVRPCRFVAHISEKVCTWNQLYFVENDANCDIGDAFHPVSLLNYSNEFSVFKIWIPYGRAQYHCQASPLPLQRP